MKNFKQPLFYLSMVVFFSSVNAQALSDLNVSGEFNLLTAFKQLPTRDQGIVGISIPSIRLGLEVPLKESNEVYVQLESTEFRDATSKRYDTQAKEAYVSFVSLVPGAEIRYGLIPNAWVEMQRGSWDYDFWGPTSETFLIKYKYSNWADIGADFHGEFGDDIGAWTVSAVNGEGGQSEEIGHGKEYQLILSYHRLAPFFVTVAYAQGAYDAIDESYNKKTRTMAELSFASEENYVGLSYYLMTDPADAIAADKLGGAVDVTPYLGTSIDGQAASLLVRKKVTARTDLFARGDWLNPVKKDGHKTLTSVTAGVSFQSNDDILWAFAAESTTYSTEFSPAARDQSQFLVATQVRF